MRTDASYAFHDTMKFRMVLRTRFNKASETRKKMTCTIRSLGDDASRWYLGLVDVHRYYINIDVYEENIDVLTSITTLT